MRNVLGCSAIGTNTYSNSLISYPRHTRLRQHLQKKINNDVYQPNTRNLPTPPVLACHIISNICITYHKRPWIWEMYHLAVAVQWISITIHLLATIAGIYNSYRGNMTLKCIIYMQYIYCGSIPLLVILLTTLV